MKGLSRRTVLALAGFGIGLALGGGRVFAAQQVVEVARSPSCNCCGAWIDHMRAEGFTVRDRLVEDLDPLKTALGVPASVQSCHTAVIDGYVIEGHVPAREIRRLLAERSSAIGLAVPGMPVGSPGMETGGTPDTYDVLIFGAEGARSFARY